MKDNNYAKPMSQELREIFTEMFSYVGAEYSDTFVQKPDWFKLYSWSEKDEYRFRRWLLSYMRDHRKELFGYKCSVARVKAAIPWFMLNYSWRYKTPISNTQPSPNPNVTESTFGADPDAWTHAAEDL